MVHKRVGEVGGTSKGGVALTTLSGGGLSVLLEFFRASPMVSELQLPLIKELIGC